MQINIEELNRVKEEIFDKYVDDKDNVIKQINDDVEKLLQDVQINQNQEETIDE